MAYFDVNSGNVKTLKFTSRGKQMESEVAKEAKQPKEGSDSEDDDKKKE